MRQDQTRRRFLLATGTLAAAGLSFDAHAQELAPTPACHDGDEPTVRQTEGPFFKPRSPQRADLREAGARGDAVELDRPRADAHAAGRSPARWSISGTPTTRATTTTRGFRFRGHQFTDANGRYRFRTIRPAVYTGRTRHYHVKVQPAGGRVLTTQLYFPDEPGNRRDSMFRRELLMKMARGGDGQAARFDFVLDIR